MRMHSFSVNQKRVIFWCILLMLWNVNDSEQNKQENLNQKSYFLSNYSKTFRIQMNQITPLENGNRYHHLHITTCSGAVYISKDINMQFLANYETEFKNWNNIFLLQKTILQTSRERTKFKPYPSKTEQVNYRLDNIRGLIARLEWFIFLLSPNLKYFEKEKILLSSFPYDT